MFIACVGLECGPHFISGFQQAGWMLFVWGAIATSIPLIVGILMARYVFKFRAGTALGCVAGARTTTAALGAVEESLHTPYLVWCGDGYTLLLMISEVFWDSFENRQ